MSLDRKVSGDASDVSVWVLSIKVGAAWKLLPKTAAA